MEKARIQQKKKKTVAVTIRDPLAGAGSESGQQVTTINRPPGAKKLTQGKESRFAKIKTDHWGGHFGEKKMVFLPTDETKAGGSF